MRPSLTDCVLAAALLAALTQAASAADLARPLTADANTIALLRFDETKGTVAKDASKNGYDATFEKAPRNPEWYKHGRFGGCLLFDGSNPDQNKDKQGDADALIWPKAR